MGRYLEMGWVWDEMDSDSDAGCEGMCFVGAKL